MFSIFLSFLNFYASFFFYHQRSQKQDEETSKNTIHEQLLQYKAKAKVILQKQSEQIADANTKLIQTEELKEELQDLKDKFSKLSNLNLHEKYDELEKKSVQQISENQDLKLQYSNLQREIIQKDRKLAVIDEEFQKEKELMNKEYEVEKDNYKKKFSEKFDSYRKKARDMLQEKEQQLNSSRIRLKNV